MRRDEKNRATDACRVPPGLTHRSWFATTVNKLKLPNGKPDTSNIDASLIVILGITMLLFIPLWNAPYSIGASLKVTPGEEVDWSNGFEMSALPYEGKNETMLLNETPYDGSPIWDTGSNFLDVKTSSNEDGFTINYPGSMIPFASFSCLSSTSVSLPDINNLFFSAIFYGNRGSCNVTLSVSFSAIEPGLWNDLFEKSITGHLSQGDILNLTLSTPIALLKTISPVWLISASMRIMISGASSAQVVIKETSIKAISDKPLYPVTIDAIATTGESLYSSYLTRNLYLFKPPAIILNRTGGNGSSAILLRRANYTVFLPQGEYSSLVGWYNYSELHPVIDGQEVTFDVTPNKILDLQLKMRTIRLDIDANPPIPFYSIRILDANGHYLLDSYYRYNPWPEHLYLPPVDGIVLIDVSFDSWYLETQTNISEGHILRLSFSSPLTFDIFGLVVNLGQLLDIILVALIFILIMKRWFVLTAHLNRRAVISDDRFVPAILLISSFLLPWVSYTDDSVYRSYYFVAMPARVVTYQGNTAFASVSFVEWAVVGTLALFLLWVPFIALLFLLPTPQSKSGNKRIAILLLLPFLYGLFNLVGVLLAGITLDLGPILAMLGLPIWLLQKLFRHKIGFPNIPLSKEKTGRDS